MSTISEGKLNEIAANIVQWNGRVTTKGLLAKMKLRKSEQIETAIRHKLLELKEHRTADNLKELERYREAFNNYRIFNTK